MERIIALSIVLLILISQLSLSRVTIGVSPSKLTLDFTKQKKYIVNFRFWNRGNEDLCLEIIGGKGIKSNITEPIVVRVKPSRPFLNDVIFPVEFYDFGKNGTYYFLLVGKPCRLNESNVKIELGIKLDVITNTTKAQVSSEPNDLINKVIIVFAVLLIISLSIVGWYLLR